MKKISAIFISIFLILCTSGMAGACTTNSITIFNNTMPMPESVSGSNCGWDYSVGIADWQNFGMGFMAAAIVQYGGEEATLAVSFAPEMLPAGSSLVSLPHFDGPEYSDTEVLGNFNVTFSVTPNFYQHNALVNLYATQVPVPSALILLASGLVAIAGLRRKLSH